jgi:hypothetical protein
LMAAAFVVTATGATSLGRTEHPFVHVERPLKRYVSGRIS